MIVQGVRGHQHATSEKQGLLFGVVAGLIPCPLTLFVMTFALTRGVPWAGIMFALVMMVGVALALSAVAIGTVLLRSSLTRIIDVYPGLLDRTSRTLGFISGAVLIAVAWSQLASSS